MLFIPLVMVNNWDCQYFSLSHKTSSIFSELLLSICSISWTWTYWKGLVSWEHLLLKCLALPHLSGTSTSLYIYMYVYYIYVLYYIYVYIYIYICIHIYMCIYMCVYILYICIYLLNIISCVSFYKFSSIYYWRFDNVNGQEEMVGEGRTQKSKNDRFLFLWSIPASSLSFYL